MTRRIATVTPVEITAGLAVVCRAVLARAPEIHEEIRTRLRAETADYTTAGTEDLAQAEQDAIAASLRDVLEFIADDSGAITRVSNELLREARIAAHAGVLLHQFLRASRVAQATLWDFLLEQAHAVLADPGERSATLRHASVRHFAWNDMVSASIIETFQVENRAFSYQSENRRRLAIVRAILADLPVDSTLLHHNLGGRHLAGHLMGDHIEAAARQVAAVTGLRPLLVLAPDDSGYLWTEWPRRLGAPKIELGALAFPAGTSLAWGTVLGDVTGFAASHRQALEARTVAAALDHQVVWYEDVMLEALALRDLGGAADFVADELGPLDVLNDPRSVLFETLEAYYASGQVAATAARILNVHSRTVAYRLAQVEKRLGPGCLRREELPVALRLARLLQGIRQEPRAGDGYSGLPTPAL